LLINDLENKTIDFEQLYTYASTHCMIPALYNAIKEKEIDAYFPEDFLNALAYITDLNKERNLEILKQIQHIATLYNTHNIDYVFLKGSALLHQKYYRSMSDRMIGDIDILVSEKDIERANHLLITNGYKPADYAIKMYFIKHRHLPRLTSKDWICAVELHHRIVEKRHKCLLPKRLLEDKEVVNNIPIPSKTHLIYNAVLNDQINDFGYLKWSLNYKALYDFLVLTKTNDYSLINLKDKYIRRFLLLKFLRFKDDSLTISLLERFKINLLKWRHRHPKINKAYHYFIVKWSTIPKLPARFINLFINKTYFLFSYNKFIIFIRKHLKLN